MRTSAPASAPTDRAEVGRNPWRGEGRKRLGLRGWRAAGGKRFWVLVAALLVLNIWVAARVSRPPARITVPYSSFTSEVERGNVKDVTAMGDQIQGDFRIAVRYPGTSRTASRFTTRRPTFAQDDLLDLL